MGTMTKNFNVQPVKPGIGTILGRQMDHRQLWPATCTDGAHHFTYLPECKPLGYYILTVLERDGGIVCAAESGLSRAD